MKEGDNFLLTDGKGNSAQAEITKAHKKACEFTQSNNQFEEYPFTEVSIGISFTKNNSRMEWFLEKATEIGVKEIIPIISHRSERESIKYERFQKILLSAMLQSKQTYVPILREAMSVQSFVQTDYDNKFLAHCDDTFERTPLSECLLNKDLMRSDMQSTCILIGPEGDFTDLEIKNAMQHKFNGVKLGETRLRTETAGVVALTLIQNLHA